MIDFITNPIIISVLILCTLCLFRVNVLLSLLVSAIAGGIAGHLSVSDVMNSLVGGMGGNSETALSYILLGAFAVAVNKNGLADLISKKIALMITSKKFVLIWIFVAMAVMSQNLIPVHIAFIPILVPPLLTLMNKMKLDRRAVACALAFGLKAPYISLPAGFGLIFQGLIADNMTSCGVSVKTQDIWTYTWILGVGMFVALLISIYITYVKSRNYQVLNNDTQLDNINKEDLKFNKSHYVTMLSAVVTLVVQLASSSLPLGALCGLTILFSFRAIRFKKMDSLISDGIYLMGYIAFVMLVAAGFASVMKATGGVDALVNSIVPYMKGSKVTATILMMVVGLFITMGIGTSFGTIPILTMLYIPICVSMSFSVPSMVIVIAAAAALGDAGSPASDTTLGPTSGLNADGQHDHIKDTCIPTFIHYNTALFIVAVLSVAILG
ncbi:MAG: sodium:proton antiporter [Succinivibrio sp.]|nr:sodium:proton antiporter [Succinivibrio sp.]